MNVQAVSVDIAESIGLLKAEGALVASVNPAGPAAAAGIEARDVILGLNSQRLQDAGALVRSVAALKPRFPIAHPTNCSEASSMST